VALAGRFPFTNISSQLMVAVLLHVYYRNEVEAVRVISACQMMVLRMYYRRVSSLNTEKGNGLVR
jgi:hypothetical protein